MSFQDFHSENWGSRRRWTQSTFSRVKMNCTFYKTTICYLVTIWTTPNFGFSSSVVFKHSFCGGEFVKTPAGSGYITSGGIIKYCNTAWGYIYRLEPWDNRVTYINNIYNKKSLQIAGRVLMSWNCNYIPWLKDSKITVGLNLLKIILSNSHIILETVKILAIFTRQNSSKFPNKLSFISMRWGSNFDKHLVIIVFVKFVCFYVFWFLCHLSPFVSQSAGCILCSQNFY